MSKPDLDVPHPGAAAYSHKSIEMELSFPEDAAAAEPGFGCWHHGGPGHHLSPEGQPLFSYKNIPGLSSKTCQVKYRVSLRASTLNSKSL